MVISSGANPVLVIDEDVLRDRAAILEDEDPVASFLASSSFQSVVPDDVEVSTLLYLCD